MSISYTNANETTDSKNIILSQLLSELEILKAENTELREERDQLQEEKEELINRYEDKLNFYHERVQELEQDRYYRRNLAKNPYLSNTQKTVLDAIKDVIETGAPNNHGLVRVHYQDLRQRTNTSEKTIGKVVNQLEEWGALEREDIWIEQKRGDTKIKKDEIYLGLAPQAKLNPLNIKPSDQNFKRNHGGARDWCRKCGSQRVRRIYHLQCLDCGHEDIRYPITEDQQDLLDDLDEATNDYIFGQDDEKCKHQHDDQHQHQSPAAPEQPKLLDSPTQTQASDSNDTDIFRQDDQKCDEQLDRHNLTYIQDVKLASTTYTCVKGHAMTTIKHKGWEAVECPICDHRDDTGERETFEV